jgi:flavin reductase (DIM6/NTAB) family NADH-FMN oxidoreductase RutF
MSEIKKQSWKPGTLIYPLPAVLVSCGATPEEYNMLTIAWTGTICTDPPMCYISVRKERHSYEIIRRTGEFAINLTTEAMARATDWCGVRSGRNENKWEATGLTPMTTSHISAAIIAESPLSICCKVRQVVELGTHDMFIADVVGIEADERYIDPESGKFSLDKASPIVYSHGEYYTLGKLIGHFGWSVRKKTKKQRR